MANWLEKLSQFLIELFKSKIPTDEAPEETPEESPEEIPSVPTPTPPSPTEPPSNPEPPVNPDPPGWEDQPGWLDHPPFGPNLKAGQIIIDAGTSTDHGISVLSGPGWLRRVQSGMVNGDYHYITKTQENGTERVTWSPNIAKEGKYEVWVSYRATENRTSAATFTVVNFGGRRFSTTINQREPLPGGARFKLLGIYYFKTCKASRKPKANFVELKNNTLRTSESVDAAFFKLVK